ncbi:MAG: hypothetical protein HKN70_08240 [Gammaproteobacteria bacterium]|nr:hypothetical protein [Gammaproteobacteria bacterium]
MTRNDLIGSWYGVYPRGRFTVLFNTRFNADGSIETVYYTCLTDVQRELEKRTGAWQYANNVITLAYDSIDSNGSSSTPFVASYRITSSDGDRVRYQSIETGQKFWKERKLTDRTYTCLTDKSTIDADRRNVTSARSDVQEHSVNELSP